MQRQLSLLGSMPIRYNGLVIETTTRCTARCDTCYQSSGPKGENDQGEVKLALKAIKRVIRESATIPTLTKKFHIAGGEAFIYPEDCLSLFDTAREAGFLEITATTNAFWGHNLQKALELALQMRKCGVTLLEISWDHWHQAYIKPRNITHVLQACHEAGIETTLRVLTTRSHTVEEALTQLQPSALNHVGRICSGPVFANGRAAATIDAKDFYQAKADDQGQCHGALQLTVNSKGEVSPCCAGFDQNKLYRHGTIHDASIAEIADRMNRDPIIRNLVFMGARSLLPIIKRANVELGDNFNNMCHLCWTIFSSEEAVQAIKDYKSNSTKHALTHVAQILEKVESSDSYVNN